jgi:Holliday junction resolvase RusA-like endonuclease
VVREGIGGYRLTIVAYRSHLLDPDNLFVKPIIDGLVKKGVIPDDTAAVIQDLRIQQKVTKAHPKVLVILEEISDDEKEVTAEG